LLDGDSTPGCSLSDDCGSLALLLLLLLLVVLALTGAVPD
jgi:hypothetical protein